MLKLDGRELRMSETDLSWIKFVDGGRAPCFELF